MSFHISKTSIDFINKFATFKSFINDIQESTAFLLNLYQKFSSFSIFSVDDIFIIKSIFLFSIFSKISFSIICVFIHFSFKKFQVHLVVKSLNHIFFNLLADFKNITLFSIHQILNNIFSFGISIQTEIIAFKNA